MDRRYLGELATCFAGPLVAALADGRALRRLAYIADKAELVSPNITVRAWLDELYELLVRYYRSEYVFKNVLANRLLLGRHSPNTSTMLFEVRSADRVADAVLLNGTSHAFEIKTDLDDMDRLAGQLDAYRQVYDHVHVVCAPSNVEEVERHVPAWAGLQVVTSRLSVAVVRQARSNLDRLSPASMFPTLRKPEYLAAVKATFAEAVKLPTGIVYQKCHEHFSGLQPQYAHAVWLRQLKRRGHRLSRGQARSLVPRSLVAAFFASPVKASQWERLGATLDLGVGDFLALPAQ